MQRRIARVAPHRAGPRTHMMLAVPADGADYLVDVGFGAGMLYPMPLRDGVSRRLVGDELTVEYADGRLERTSVAPERLDATLRELNVILDPAELAALADRRS